MRKMSLRQGTFSFERPNGQRYLAGDFGTGSNLEFLSTHLRGGSASIPVGGTIFTGFGGRTYSALRRPFRSASANFAANFDPRPLSLRHKRVRLFRDDKRAAHRKKRDALTLSAAS